nr:PDDEXK nuclease domain-containing protein [Elizabethkingia sp. ASV34]
MFFKPVSVDKQKFIPNKNPTIGILLCTNKNDAVVKFTLPENQKQIFASQYELYLQTEKQLLDEVNKELESFEEK